MKPSLLEELKIIYFFTKIPIHLFSDYEYITSYCSNSILHELMPQLNWIEELLSEKKIDDSAYIENAYFESYKLLKTTYTNQIFFIVIGPFLSNISTTEHKNNLVKSNVISFEELTKKRNYFDNLVSLDSKAKHHLHLLMQSVLNNEGQNGKSKIEPLLNHFYKNRITYLENYYLHPPYLLEQRLLNCIQNGNSVEAKKLVARLNTYRDASLANDRIRSYKNSLICRCTLYARAIIQGGINSEQSFTLSDTFINRIEAKNSIEALYTLDMEMIDGFSNSINKKKELKYSLIVNNALNYINKHLNEKLSVKLIAEKIYIHPNYLSTLFKSEVEQNLVEYIQRLRIKESEYFLEYTNNPISDISSFFQFSSQSYYTKIFKKYNRITPAQFRQMHLVPDTTQL